MRLSLVVVLTISVLVGCKSNGNDEQRARTTDDTPVGRSLTLSFARQRMLDVHLRARGIDDQILAAMAAVPREEFVPDYLRERSYDDSPLPIGYGQTISQPFVVAAMTQAAEPRETDRALEVGTGSGYQAAVLSELVDTVYSVEIVPELTARAVHTFARLGYDNIVAVTRDGYRGWPEFAPFDIILVTAAPDHVPQPLIDQLAPGGRMVIPVGDAFQQLQLIRKTADGDTVVHTLFDVRFVPMTGEARDYPFGR